MDKKKNVSRLSREGKKNGRCNEDGSKDRIGVNIGGRDEINE